MNHKCWLFCAGLALFLNGRVCYGQSDIQVTITSPTNHAILVEGETNVITWSVSGSESGSEKIAMKLGLESFSSPGFTWYDDKDLLITGSSGYVNSFVWVVPKFSQIPGDMFLLEIIPVNNAVHVNMNPFYLTIEPRKTVTMPQSAVK